MSTGRGTPLVRALALQGVSGDSGSHLGSTLNPGGAVLTLGVFRRSRSVAYIPADASPSEVLASAIVPPRATVVNPTRETSRFTAGATCRIRAASSRFDVVFPLQLGPIGLRCQPRDCQQRARCAASTDPSRELFRCMPALALCASKGHGCNLSSAKRLTGTTPQCQNVLASTSLGKASLGIQARLPESPDKPCTAEALTRGCVAGRVLRVGCLIPLCARTVVHPCVPWP
jgi:hypothetical protein